MQTFLAGAFFEAPLPPFGFTTSATLSDGEEEATEVRCTSYQKANQKPQEMYERKLRFQVLPVSMEELVDIAVDSETDSALVAFLLFLRGFLGGCLDILRPASVITLLFIFFLAPSAWASLSSCS